MKKSIGLSKAFTIVELLIVIIVIAVLAAIIIISYNGITQSARTATVQANLDQVAQQIRTYAIQNSDQYPSSLATVGVVSTDPYYQYTYDNSAHTFCVTATTKINGGFASYSEGSAKDQSNSVCTGQNIFLWDPTVSWTTPSLAGGMSFDSATYHNGSPSISASASSGSVRLTLQPGGSNYMPVKAGDIYVVDLWYKTTADYNAPAGNSKIRLDSSDAATHPVQACSFSVVTSWTEITCSYTVASSYTNLQVELWSSGGSTGTIWWDDIVLKRTN